MGADFRPGTESPLAAMAPRPRVRVEGVSANMRSVEAVMLKAGVSEAV